jgi:hypothetical protein
METLNALNQKNGLDALPAFWVDKFGNMEAIR